MLISKSAHAKALAFIATTCLALSATEQGNSQTPVTHRIPSALAMEAVESAVSACTANGFAVTATVIDVDAQRIATLRADTAGVQTFETSWGKAYTAVGFAPIYKLDSSGAVAVLFAQLQAKEPAGTLAFQEPPGMIFRAGGLTIKLGNEVIGAIGVGGSPTADEDEACARAGLDRIRGQIH